ncbi:MAG: hypothetical protein M1820_005079 [Bogoriella megaspora]|nr:MAG: hypothetical protein M1820_005079 [Bogoriella megaspora]
MSGTKENGRSVKSLTLTPEEVDPESVSGIVRAVLGTKLTRVSMRVDQQWCALRQALGMEEGAVVGYAEWLERIKAVPGSR